MPLRQCIAAHTHRELLTWLAWLDNKESNPDPTQYYLMQIAAEVRRVLAKNPSKVKLDDFQLQFNTAGSQATPDPEQAVKHSKHRWRAFLGMGHNSGSSD